MADADLIIVGASARAAAYSARRAGFRPWCADLFADVDLTAIAPTVRVAREAYPDGLVRLVREQAPQAPLIYTGGLENAPEVYRELAKCRPVWGYLHPDPLYGESVRNPEFLQSVCGAVRIARPPLSLNAGGVPVDGMWLVKPRAGSGGRRVAVWRGQTLEEPSGYYFQQYVEGISLSAVFIARDGAAELVGVTRQLVGESFVHAPGAFSYCGNVTVDVASLDGDVVGQFTLLGTMLVGSDPYLRGLFGIDAVLAEERLHLIEVNPRYTASVEVVEQATGRALIWEHARAFVPAERLPTPVPSPEAPPPGVGKAVYFALFNHTFTLPLHRPTGDTSWPGYADISALGTRIGVGEPVVTLLESGKNPEAGLRRKARELDALLVGPVRQRGRD